MKQRTKKKLMIVAVGVIVVGIFASGILSLSETGDWVEV